MVHFELITKAMKIFKFSNNLMIAVFVHPGEVDVESLAKFIASIQRDGGVDRTIKFARSPSDKLWNHDIPVGTFASFIRC